MNKPLPRFVMVIGSTRERYPDIPEAAENGGGICLWDRWYNRPVMTLHAEYANAICLETTPDGAPFTMAEEWFNNTSVEAFESEGIEC